MKTAFCFAGQGSQYVGMAKDLYEAYPVVREVFMQAEDVLRMPIKNLCFDGPKEQLDETCNTQPVILTVEMAIYRLLRDMDIAADIMVGFSLGEYAAHVAAGTFSFEQGLELISVRAEAMQAAMPLGEGAMAAVIGKDEATVASLCEKAENVWPANYNCPGQIVISGTAKGVQRAIALAAEAHIIIMPLPVSIPSHCQLMQPAADVLADYLKRVPFIAPVLPIVPNADNIATSDPSRLKESLIKQLTSPVRYGECLRMLYESGVDKYIEIGPKHTLSTFAKKTIKGVSIWNVESVETLDVLLRERRE